MKAASFQRAHEEFDLVPRLRAAQSKMILAPKQSRSEAKAASCDRGNKCSRFLTLSSAASCRTRFRSRCSLALSPRREACARRDPFQRANHPAAYPGVVKVWLLRGQEGDHTMYRTLAQRRFSSANINDISSAAIDIWKCVCRCSTTPLFRW